MKQLKLLGCVLALGAFALFTGCGGDNNDNNSNNQPSGTNAPASIASSTVTLTPADGTGPHVITTDAAGGYSASFDNGASSETGTYTYAANGDNANLVLTPSGQGPEGVSNISLAFNPSQTDGNYTSDKEGNGTFTVAGGTP